MSIKIDDTKCVGCGKCLNICPGSLIYKNEEGKAFIKYTDNCWGCTACLKECSFSAIEYYLGADIGGNGSFLYTEEKDKNLYWHIVKKDGKEIVIITNKKEANKY